MIKHYDIEDLYTTLGLFGNFQIFVVVIYSIGERMTASILDFQVHMLSVVPDWHCISDDCMDLTFNQTYLNKSILCQLDRDDWNWNGDRSNLVTQFDLVCKDTYKISLGSTCFFMTYPIGSLLVGLMSDWLGRKWIATSFLFVTGIITSASALISNYIVFVVFRSIEGFCIGGLTVTFYPLLIEYCGAKARNLTNVIAQCGYGLGMAFLCFTAYYIDNWRGVVITNSVHLFIIAVLLGYNIPESPRFLLKVKKHEEAKEVLRTMARWNKVELPDEFEITQGDEASEKERAWKLLTFSCYTCSATLAQMFIWFTAALYFFALSFNMNDIMGNPYLNLAVTGVVEVVVNMLSYFVIDRIGRRPCMLISFFLCGASVGICRFLPHAHLNYAHFSLKTFWVIFGRVVGGFIYSLVYLYSAEIFPTTVRSSGLGACVFAAQISSLIAPFVIVINTDNSNIIYTVLFIFCIFAFLATLILPETAHKPLPRTIADMDAMKNSGKGESERLIGAEHQPPGFE